MKTRITFLHRDSECLPPYRVCWWEEGVPYTRTFLSKTMAKKFYRILMLDCAEMQA